MRFQHVEQVGNAVEEPGKITQLAGVDFEKTGSQTFVFVMRAVDAESLAKQPAHTLRRMRAQAGKRLLRSTLFSEQNIHCPAQVGCRIRQRAVKVEKYRVKHYAWRVPGN